MADVIPFPRKRAEPPAECPTSSVGDGAAFSGTADGLSVRANAIREMFGYPIDPPDFENEPKESA